MQDRLLVFKPAVVARREALSLTEPTRKYPVVLDSHAFTETVRMKLPAGFEVDELPDPVKLDTAFGSYKTSYVVKDGELVFTRALAQRATYNSFRTLPVSAQFLRKDARCGTGSSRTGEEIALAFE